MVCPWIENVQYYKTQKNTDYAVQNKNTEANIKQQIVKFMDKSCLEELIAVG